MMGYYGNNWGGFDFFGMIMMLLFWVLIVWGLIMLIRWLGYSQGGGQLRHHMGRHHMNHQSGGGSDAALSILKERYAKGEISMEEYEERKKVLMG